MRWSSEATRTYEAARDDSKRLGLQLLVGRCVGGISEHIEGPVNGEKREVGAVLEHLCVEHERQVGGGAAQRRAERSQNAREPFEISALA
jgi:hypothetical protein